ncbi:MAG: hypothetical protein FJ090_05130 [Deltaproteobacteria bacterium]|nr:hypothetical protein [Deltaproteobacteria bacterium]
MLLLFACTSSDDPKDTADTSSSTDTGDTAETSDFDTACFAQVMQSQEVCECSTVTFDWSGVTHDSAGEPFAPSDVLLVHWYIFDMPVSTLDTALCSGGDLGMNTFATSSSEADALSPSPTSQDVEIGEWTRQTGVLALYDQAASDGAQIWPRAAAIFTFNAESSNRTVAVEGRGDVYTE